MSKKTVIWILVVAAAAVGLVFLIGSREKPEAKYRTATVDRGDITQTVTATGTVSAVTTVQVGSQVSGIISKLYVDFNSKVKKGDMLAELDPTPFQAQVEQQQAAVTKAKVDTANTEINFNRQKRLLADGLAAQSDFDSAKAAYDSARAQVEQAKAALSQAETNLHYTKITSPIDGTVVARQYDVGQTVAASFQAPTLFTIAQDLTKMQVSADVSESDIGRIQVGQPVRFNVDAYPERQFRGNVSQIRLNATVNQNVVTYPVIVEVSNPDLLLRPTMTANVTVDVAVVHDVVRVANAALRWKPETAPATATATGAGPSVEERAAAAGQQKGTGGMARQFGQTGGQGGGRPGGGAGGGKGGARPATVYEAQGPKGEPKPVEIRPGITDGRNTQVVSGDLKPGDTVIVGLTTAKANTTGSALPGGGGRRF
jgi:HlyD family secretion protein